MIGSLAGELFDVPIAGLTSRFHVVGVEYGA
jgi:hypothetical protein